jgi:hypothetical protein
VSTDLKNDQQVREERIKKNQAAIELLRQWRDEGNAEEQRETGEYLMRVLDEDRPSQRKLFPRELFPRE